MDRQTYISPFTERYSGKVMSKIFSPDNKYRYWRKLWIALADAQHALGLPIKKEQIAELKEKEIYINYDAVAAYEKKFRHDVMAHLHAFGDLCPKAKPILHLGATSCFVTDNGDLLQIRDGLEVIRANLLDLVRTLAGLANQYKELPCLAYTHMQPAQPTTMGKRICLWLQDFLMDFIEIDSFLQTLPFLGVKGTTGTQASFLKLFDNDSKKVKALDELVSKKMGFTRPLLISGQTYTRKIDHKLLSLLGGIACSTSKMATDLRLLSHLKEVFEPFEEDQIGSSAMPYKCNPVRSERICALARFVLNLQNNAGFTASNQWLERSLDDSANRRLAIAESFLAIDGILHLVNSITQGLRINTIFIERNIQKELPFLCTENILMYLTTKLGDRQAIHEKLRQHSRNAIDKMAASGGENDLIERILADSTLAISREEIEKLCKIEQLTGMANIQVEEFIKFEVRPVLDKHKHINPFFEEVLV